MKKTISYIILIILTAANINALVPVLYWNDATSLNNMNQNISLAGPNYGIVFKNTSLDVKNFIYLSSETTSSLSVLQDFYVNGQLYTHGDIYSRGSGDDFWLGTDTQAAANIRLYANGSAYIINLNTTNLVSKNANLDTITTTAATITNLNSSTLQMAGYLRLQNRSTGAPVTCNSANFGDLYANWTTKKINWCNSTAWVAFG